MDIHVNRDDHVRVFVDGNLQAEITLQNTRGIDDLNAEVERARHLEVLARFLSVAMKNIDNQSFGDGLLSGLREESVQHPMDGVPNIAPNHNPQFLKGWDIGMALRGVASNTPPRHKPPEWANPWSIERR